MNRDWVTMGWVEIGSVDWVSTVHDTERWVLTIWRHNPCCFSDWPRYFRENILCLKLSLTNDDRDETKDLWEGTKRVSFSGIWRGLAYDKRGNMWTKHTFPSGAIPSVIQFSVVIFCKIMFIKEKKNEHNNHYVRIWIDVWFCVYLISASDWLTVVLYTEVPNVDTASNTDLCSYVFRGARDIDRAFPTALNRSDMCRTWIGNCSWEQRWIQCNFSDQKQWMSPWFYE